MNELELLLLEYTRSEIEAMDSAEREEIAAEILEEMKCENLADVLGYNQ